MRKIYRAIDNNVLKVIACMQILTIPIADYLNPFPIYEFLFDYHPISTCVYIANVFVVLYLLCSTILFKIECTKKSSLKRQVEILLWSIVFFVNIYLMWFCIDVVNTAIEEGGVAQLSAGVYTFYPYASSVADRVNVSIAANILIVITLIIDAFLLNNYKLDLDSQRCKT